MITLLKRLRDDRGCEIHRLTDTELKGDGEHAEHRRQLINRLGAVVRSARRWQELPQTVAIICFHLCVFTGAALALKLGAQAALGGFALGIGAAVGALKFLPRWKLSEQIAASAVAEGFCGACAHSLRYLMPEDDGCVLCSECGAAWNRLRITNPHWVSTTQDPPLNLRSGRRWFGRRKQEMLSDSHGKFVPWLGWTVRSVPKATLQALGPEAQRLLGRALWREQSARRRSNVMAVGVLCLFLTMLLLGGVGLWTGYSRLGALIAVPIPALVVCAVGLSPVAKPERYARVMVDHGVCGSCGGVLAGVRVYPDGCVVCPQCKAAWKVDGA